MDYAEKMQETAMKMGFREYIEALEEERTKIQVFQRELPLCLELVTQAIECCMQQLSGTTTEHGGESESSEEEIHREGRPLLEECITVKRTESNSDFDGEEERQSDKSKEDYSKNNEKKKVGQSDWLRSAQLWNQTPNPPPKQDGPMKALVIEVKRNGGAFKPFHRHIAVENTTQAVVVSDPPAATSSTADTASEHSGGSHGSRKEKGQTHRKQRRCWSPELHRRFLHALQQLGAATPKQIRKLMKVDGLTNDEVKSHLQKHRLHTDTRRPSTVIHNNGTSQAPQFVVVGGIWVSPPDYATVAAPAPPLSVSQPTSTVIQRPQPKRSKQSHSNKDGVSE